MLRKTHVSLFIFSLPLSHIHYLFRILKNWFLRGLQKKKERNKNKVARGNPLEETGHFFHDLLQYIFMLWFKEHRLLS